MWFINIALFVIVARIHVGAQEIIFGAVFDDSIQEKDFSHLSYEEAFNISMSVANLGQQFHFRLLSEVYKPTGGPFKAQLQTCSLIEKKALIIFGPTQQEDIDIVQSICDFKDIAHVITRWIFDPSQFRNIINFYPHSSYLTMAYFSVLTLARWKSFTLFYEDNESLLRMTELLTMTKDAEIVVVVKQLDEVGNGIYRTTLKEAAHSGEKNFVLDCSVKILEEVLLQAQQVGMINSQYNFFITNLDLQTIDLEPFRYSGVNITGIRIFDPSTFMAQAVRQKSKKELDLDVDVSRIRTESALIVDAVQVLAEVINEKFSIMEMNMDSTSCDSLNSTKHHGLSISNHVKTHKKKSLTMTGPIEFDGYGFRSNFDLDIISITENGVEEIGTWNSSKGLITIQPNGSDDDGCGECLRNKTFIVQTCLTAPYCMLKETSKQLLGNERFEGFAIDLIHELALMEGFNYTFVLRDDKSNGAKDNATGKWSGMIGDVIDGTVHFAITDLTITADREEAVDFTSPFMNLGISILARKPGNAPPSFFSFADPFALDTWIMLAIAYTIVSLSFFILGRLCPAEWTNPYPCVEEPEFLINQFSIQNSAWWAAGSLMQQGTELGPIGISTRMVSAIWWFFVLIIVSSYTANLAAFLATENPVHLFTDITSLVQNLEKNNLKMGAKSKGATETFFKDKDNSIYRAVYEYMKTHPEDMAETNEEGVEMAEKEDINYAFFMESTSIEYETQRHCDLQQYGKQLDDKGYGIAMKKNSPYRTRLSTAILKLQSSGELDKLKRKWWEEKRGGGQCLGDGGEPQTDPLYVANVEGVVYVTVGGTILAVFLVIVQMLLNIRKISKKTRTPFGEVFRMEMKALLDVHSNTKPTIKKKSASGSKSSRDSDHLTAPAAYGFIPTITKEELKD